MIRTSDSFREVQIAICISVLPVRRPEYSYVDMLPINHSTPSSALSFACKRSSRAKGCVLRPRKSPSFLPPYYAHHEAFFARTGERHEEQRRQRRSVGRGRLRKRPACSSPLRVTYFMHTPAYPPRQSILPPDCRMYPQPSNPC